MALLERGLILQQLADLLDGALNASGRLVCLSGEAGIGKSSIARAFANSIGDKARILWGACEDLSTAEPLGAISELLHATPLAHSPDAAPFGSILDELTAMPTLVVVEDLHWADDATLDFIRFIGRRIEKARILLLVTARDDTADAQSRLRRALVNVPADSCVRIQVPPLSKTATTKLAATTQLDGQAVYALTNGNPFMVAEVLRHPTGVPETVRQALLWRADRLSPDGRQTIEAASIFPRRVEAWLLEMMCGKGGTRGIAECIDRGLLTPDADYFSFRHEIARQAIETSLLPTRKAQLNAAAMRYLMVRHPEATARLVHHAIAADDVDAIVAMTPKAAAEAAAAGAHRQAARHYQAALAHASAYDSARRAELCERAGFELQLIGQVHDAIALFKTAHALHLDRGDARGAGDALRWISRLSYNVGDRAGADRFGLEAIATLEPMGNGPELAMAYANVALISALKDDLASAWRWADLAMRLGIALERKDIIADAHGTLGITQGRLDIEAARTHFATGLALALELNRPEIAARIYSNSSCIELNAHCGIEARRWLDAGIAYCRDRDLDSWWTYMSGWLAELLVREGQWDEAQSIAQHVLDLPLVSLVLRFPATVALARLSIRRGDPGLAYSEADLTFEKEAQRLLVYAPVLGERAWINEADIEETLALLKEALAVAATVGNVWAAGEITYWMMKLGEDIDGATAVAPPFQLQFSGDWQGAAEAWARVPAPYEQALALLEGDEVARKKGLAILDNLSAAATAARFRKEFKQRGVRGIARGPRPSTRANAAGLTRREVEVLGSIEAGHSNLQISAAFGVSVKTIDNHVSSILAKLGAASRGEAAARARRLGIIKSD